jgi:hypothetical protein
VPQKARRIVLCVPQVLRQPSNQRFASTARTCMAPQGSAPYLYACMQYNLLYMTCLCINVLAESMTRHTDLKSTLRYVPMQGSVHANPPSVSSKIPESMSTPMLPSAETSNSMSTPDTSSSDDHVGIGTRLLLSALFRIFLWHVSS